MYIYLIALHIIFIVTWFAGLFYIGRLLIYHREVQDKAEPDKTILSIQLILMTQRLWKIITWPSAILTLILGITLWFQMGTTPNWLWVKLGFVITLYTYHFSLHKLISQQSSGIFKYSSQQLRYWNEVPSLLLIAIVMLAIVKNSLSWIWGFTGLFLLMLLLFLGVKLYKHIRGN